MFNAKYTDKYDHPEMRKYYFANVIELEGDAKGSTVRDIRFIDTQLRIFTDDVLIENAVIKGDGEEYDCGYSYKICCTRSVDDKIVHGSVYTDKYRTIKGTILKDSVFDGISVATGNTTVEGCEAVCGAFGTGSSVKNTFFTRNVSLDGSELCDSIVRGGVYVGGHGKSRVSGNIIHNPGIKETDYAVTITAAGGSPVKLKL